MVAVEVITAVFLYTVGGDVMINALLATPLNNKSPVLSGLNTVLL